MSRSCVELALSVARARRPRSGAGSGPWHLVDGLGWAGAAAAVRRARDRRSASSSARRVSFWRGHLQERRWGFSTQSPRRLARRPAQGRGGRPPPDCGVLGRRSSASPAGCPRPGRRSRRRRACACGRASSRSSRPSCSSRSSTASAARRRAARGGAARARRARRRPGPRRPRRRREPAHDEGERVRLRASGRRGASSSTTRCSRPRTRASSSSSSRTSSGTGASGTSSSSRLGAMAGAALWVVLLWALLGSRIASPRELPLVLLISLGLRARRRRSGRRALPALGARRRPLLARADARSAVVRAHAPAARAEEPRRPRAAAPRLPAPLHASDGSGAPRARARLGGAR